jgi:hypothetical protein
MHFGSDTFAMNFKLTLLAVAVSGLVTSAQAASVPKWDRFERSLESSVNYANPVQEATVTATFVSPSGENFKVPGFWDGGKTWRVRFSPNKEGKWTFATTCSDAGNKGLHQQKGEFTCGAASGNDRFSKHGPVRVSADGRYLMHEDSTPFFFLADTAWNAALRSTDEEWNSYIKTRSEQKFTAAQWVTTQWRTAPDGDIEKQLAYTGPTNRIVINPKFFQRLDRKVEALNKAGLLNVPVLLWAIRGGGNAQVNPGVLLAEDQAILLARYMVARWGGNDVAWILGGDGDYRGERAQKWRRIGRAVFNDIAHAPVTMHPQGMQWVWNEFKDEKWYDFVGYQSGHGDDEKALRWLSEGPITEDWARLPHKPIINLEPPYENHLGYASKKPLSADFVRRAMYWSMLNTPSGGITYGGHGVWGWDDGTKAPVDHGSTGTPLPWKKALTMPAAEQMKFFHDFFTTNDFWRLRPTPMFVVNNPGKESPAKFISAARTDNKDLLIVYVPEDRTVEIKLDALPPSPNVTWLNPRTGENSPAVAVVTQNTCQFPTPSEGDWLLITRSQPEKPEKEKTQTAAPEK